VDYAIEKIEAVNEFLKQSITDKIELPEAVEKLIELFE
jgi:flagellar biosynthesis/type III secretory pathway ATPase